LRIDNLQMLMGGPADGGGGGNATSGGQVANFNEIHAMLGDELDQFDDRFGEDAIATTLAQKTHGGWSLEA